MADMTPSVFYRVLEALIPGAVGSSIGLSFLPGKWYNKLLSFLSGMACSYYFGGALNELLDIQGKFTANAILFTIGVFGLSIVHQMQPMLQKIINDLWALILASLKKWTGA